MASTVLILEDDPHTVEVVQLYLRQDGHNVLSETYGIPGLSLAREAQPSDAIGCGQKVVSVLAQVKQDHLHRVGVILQY